MPVNKPVRGQRTATNKKTTTAKKKALPKIPKDMSKMNLTRVKPTKSEQRVKADLAQQGRQSKATVKKMSAANTGGFSPSKLSASDRALYNKYVAKYGKPSTKWANGKPRNPMTEVRNQMSAEKKK